MNKLKLIKPLRHLTNALYFLVRREKNLYSEYLKIVTLEKCDFHFSEGNVLVTPISCAEGHFFEGIFARKAMMQGHKVYALLCGQGMERCDTVNCYNKQPTLTCTLCAAQQDNFAECFGITPILYSSILCDSDIREAERLAECFLLSQNEDYYLFNVNIKQVLYPALQRYYLMANPALQNDFVCREFLLNIYKTLFAMKKICDELNPKYVISSHGIYSAWGAVVEYCKANSIYVVTWGRTYNKNGIQFAYNQSYLTLDLDDQENSWMKTTLTDEKKNIAVNFYMERLGLKDAELSYDYNKGNKENYTREEINRILGISPEKKIVGLFPNIPWDGQVTGAADVFASFTDWLHKTIEFFLKQRDIVLVIRSHPAEALFGENAGKETVQSIITELYQTLPPNIIILPARSNINSYTLGENSLFALTYSSTVSLELTFLNIPVILVGNPPFKNKGIVFDVNSTDQYVELLKQGVEGKLKVTASQKVNLYKFTTYFYFQKVMPERTLKMDAEKPIGFNFDNERELLTSPCLNYMYSCIEEQKEMDFIPFYNKE